MANHSRPWKRERMRVLMRKGVEFVDILEEKIFLGIWWKERRKEKGKKKERKRKMKEEDIFSNLENENIGNTDSRV